MKNTTLKLRKEFFNDYTIYEIIVGRFNLMGKQLHCCAEVTTKRVYFRITCRKDNYISPPYDSLDEAIFEWNNYDE